MTGAEVFAKIERAGKVDEVLPEVIAWIENRGYTVESRPCDRFVMGWDGIMSGSYSKRELVSYAYASLGWNYDDGGSAGSADQGVIDDEQEETD